MQSPRETANFQELLASLYLSSSEREHYFACPEDSARAYGFSTTLLHLIPANEKEPVDFYAKSLKRKRFQEVIQFIPKTGRSWEMFLRTAFDAYSEKCIPSGPKKHIADLIHFSNYLTTLGHLPQEARDCLKFELAPWEMNFKLSEKEHIYKRSQTTTKVVEAHRRVGFNFKTIIYKTRLSDLNSFDGRISKTNRLGIYLKLPFLSKSLEWYLPLPRLY